MEAEGKLSTHSTSKEEDGEVHRVCDENQDSKGGWTTFPFVIATVLGLSVAVGGWGANLIVFLITKFNVKTITAIQINNIILGTTNLLPIAGAFIADSFFTIFSVVSAFSFISLLLEKHQITAQTDLSLDPFCSDGRSDDISTFRPSLDVRPTSFNSSRCRELEPHRPCSERPTMEAGRSPKTSPVRRRVFRFRLRRGISLCQKLPFDLTDLSMVLVCPDDKA